MLRKLLFLYYILFTTSVISKEIPVIVIAPSKKPQSISTVGTSVSILDENFFKNYTDLSLGRSDPDLIIRTGGEHRLSNFMLWHAAYSEIEFSDVLWPDFDGKQLEKSIKRLNKRNRRYGGLSTETDEINSEQDKSA